MDEQVKALSAYRLEKAEQCLRSAEIILNIGDDNNLVINRSYYAIFHGMRSVLALESKDFEKHSYLISNEQGLDDFGSSAYFVETEWLLKNQ